MKSVGSVLFKHWKWKAKATTSRVNRSKQWGGGVIKLLDFSPHLSHHAVPGPVDLFAMLPICDQVQVVRKLDRFGDLLQDVDAEALTATLDVDPRLLGLIAA